MSTATELAYGLSPTKPIPAVVIIKLAESLRLIARYAKSEGEKATDKKMRATLHVIQGCAEHPLEEYLLETFAED